MTCLSRRSGAFVLLVGVASTASPQDGAAILEEVTVTATRQVETVNTVPLSIQAITQDSLDRQGIKSTADLVRAVQGLAVGANPGGAQQTFSIRGIVGGTGAATTKIRRESLISPIERPAPVDDLAYSALRPGEHLLKHQVVVDGGQPPYHRLEGTLLNDTLCENSAFVRVTAADRIGCGLGDQLCHFGAPPEDHYKIREPQHVPSRSTSAMNTPLRSQCGSIGRWPYL